MITVAKLAELVGGKVLGNGEINITGMARSSSAKEGDITFAFTKEELEGAVRSKASSVLTADSVENCSKPVLRVPDMKTAVTVLYNVMLEWEHPVNTGVHPLSSIAKSATLGKNVLVGPFVVIGENAVIGDDTLIGASCTIGDNVTIGKKTRLCSNVTVYGCVVIGNKVILHSGVVIGSDGFGYVPKDGKIYKVPQMGRVVIENDVEIGANSCVDRGTFVDTVIGAGSKIDNLVQIAHNVKVGKMVLIAAQTGIGGSAAIGDGTMMGGQSGISDHITVGKSVRIGAKTGITSRTNDNEVLFGYPAREANEARKLNALLSLIVRNEKKFRKMLRELPEESK